MTRRLDMWISIIILVIFAGVGGGLVMTSDKGDWPADWPKSLEPFRAHARTIEVASGTQENIYEITFSDRDTFENAWPTILSLKTPGAPLTLYRAGSEPPKGLGTLLSNASPIVRIYGPSEGTVSGADGVLLKAGAPWPKDLPGNNGELPEYVQTAVIDGKTQWIDVEKAKDKTRGFHNRARVDIELVVDGKVIDLNRIALPGNTPIVDHRF